MIVPKRLLKQTFIFHVFLTIIVKIYLFFIKFSINFKFLLNLIELFLFIGIIHKLFYQKS